MLSCVIVYNKPCTNAWNTINESLVISNFLKILTEERQIYRKRQIGNNFLNDSEIIFFLIKHNNLLNTMRDALSYFQMTHLICYYDNLLYICIYF